MYKDQRTVRRIEIEGWEVLVSPDEGELCASDIPVKSFVQALENFTRRLDSLVPALRQEQWSDFGKEGNQFEIGIEIKVRRRKEGETEEGETEEGDID